MSYSGRYLYMVLPYLLLGIIYWPVFVADYAYLDEAHQLWYNQDDSNFAMFATQGRFITGWIIEYLFDSTNTVTELKIIRILSLISGFAALAVWQYCIHSWNKLLNLPPFVIFFSTLFFICCPSFAIYIGWASCVEVFIGCMAALLAGHLLFMSIYQQDDHISIPSYKILVIATLSLTSLFVYQICYGAFLLPFLLHFIFVKRSIHKKLIISILFYILLLGIYYLLFKYSLKFFSLTAADRTGISTNPLEKLSFFISHILSQAFSFNFLYNLRGIFSQAFYPIAALIFLIILYSSSGKNKRSFFTTILVFFLLVALISIPLLIAKESFASYRTIFIASLAVSTTMFGLVYQCFQKKLYKNIFTINLSIIIPVVGYYNFHHQFVNPLWIEYKLLRSEINTWKVNAGDTVLFIRPQEEAFTKRFNVNVYKDEFGLPSTYKDWVPEPLIRQIVFEKTKDRSLAQSLYIQHYLLKDAPATKITSNHFLDMNQLLQR